MTYQIQYGNIILAESETKGGCILQLNAKPEIKIFITEEEKTKRAFIQNKHWINKNPILLQSYTNEFSDSEIFSDIAEKVCLKNGYTLVRLKNDLTA